MKSPSLIVLAVSVIMVTSPRVRSQETPTILTRGEYQCQNAFGRSVLTVSGETGACLTDCRSRPGGRCSTSFPDPITRDCLQRARADAEIQALRKCAGATCPECYEGGDCPDYIDSGFSQAISDVDAGLSTLFCDDSFSADGLTRDEQRCQQGLARAGGRFVASLEHCFAQCQQAVHRGAMGFSSCDSAFLDAPSFDARTQRCVDKARARLLASCTDHCKDPPECLNYTCPTVAVAVEAEAIRAVPATYCQEPGVCGDGQVTGPEVCDPFATPTGCRTGTDCDFSCRTCTTRCGDGLLVPGEVCDQSATPNGCPAGFDCQGCDFCVPRCGNGFTDSDEACDRSDVTSCGAGSACNATCSACDPTESATGRLAPCDFFFPSDTWTFDVTGGQNVVVRADDISTQPSAGLELFGSCTSGQSFSGFENFPCSGAGAGIFFCPAAAFLADSDATCYVTVEPFFCSSSATFYQLDVSGTGLQLVSSSSPSGAFLDALP